MKKRIRHSRHTLQNIIGGKAVAGSQATVKFDITALRYVSSASGLYIYTLKARGISATRKMLLMK